VSGTAYSQELFKTYLDDVSSGKPAPGGGSVSACVGALGAALVAMVGNLTIGKEKFAGVEARMKAMIAAAGATRRRLEQLLQDDTAAYNGVIDAYKLPKSTDEERSARSQAIQDGLVGAADVPLEICRAAIEACRLAKVAADLGNPAAITDAGVGAVLGEAAVAGAALNVRINLCSIEDEAYVARASAEIAAIQTEAAALRDQVLSATLARL
jgi:methenyltetrahydrofolate cyclohydrolase